MEYSLLGNLDCCQEEDKCGVLLYFILTLNEFQTEAKEIEDYFRVVNTLLNGSSNP